MRLKKEHKKIVDHMEKDLGFIPETLQVIKEVCPDYLKVVKLVDEVLFRDGAIDAKTKRLIAVAVVAATQCVDCVDAQVQAALNKGATLQEIVEALGVAVATAGVPALSSSKRALRMAKELTKK